MTTPDPTPFPTEIPDISQIDFLKERYSGFEKLGSGGMGTVFRAYDKILSIDVAIKILNHTNLSDIQVIRFQQEAKAASRFSHPSLISIFDFGAGPEGELYLVMEYVEGKSLQDVLEEDGPIVDEGKAFSLLTSIARAMHYIHSRDVIHRDLKPSNIMLLDDGSIRIIDFGIAKLEAQDESQSLTATGIAIGSPAYMSPEQLRGSEIDNRTDIYSFGCLMYKMITGQPIIESQNIVELMSTYDHRTLPSLADNAGQEFASRLEPIYQKLTQEAPASRYQSFDEVVEDLSRAKDGELTGESSIEEAEVDGTRSGSSKKKLTVIASIVCVLAIVAASQFINSKSSNPEKDLGKKVAKVEYSHDPPFVQRDEGGIMRWSPPVTFGFKDSDFRWLKGRLSKTKPEYFHIRDSFINGTGFDYVVGANVINIDASGSRITNEGLASIAKLKGLQSLKIAEAQITDEGLKQLKFDQLHTIDINFCKKITNKGIKYLIANNPNLAKLRFGATGATKEVFKELVVLKRLQEVDVFGLKLEDEDLVPLTKIDSMIDIDIRDNPKLTDKSLDILANAQHLEQVVAAGCTLITPEGIDKLKKKRSEINVVNRNTKKSLIDNREQFQFLEGLDSIPDYH